MVNGFLCYAGGSMGYDMPEVDYEEYWQAGGHDALAVRGPLHAVLSTVLRLSVPPGMSFS